MADREKVIKAIEICYTLGHNCTECPLFPEDDCNDKLMHDALSLLKAQEPRVLTIEEVEALEEGTIVWVEENYGGQRYLNPMVCNGDGFFGNFYLGIDISIWLYDGKKRFWTSKPTKEQSEATPWEPPKEG